MALSSRAQDEMSMLIKKIFVGCLTAIVFFVVIIIVFGSWYTIPPGHRGVIVRLGAVQKGVQGEGLHFKLPWVDDIEKLNVQVQKDEVEANAASHDLQIVTTKIASNFNLVPEVVDQIYQEIGFDYANKVIAPAVQEIVKAVTAKYTAEELITKRADVKMQIKQLLADRLLNYHIRLVDVSIADFNFSKAFNEAIEAKQVAEQQVATARNNLDRIKVEAMQKVTQAEAEAKALDLQRQVISQQLIELRTVENQKMAIERWDGHLPQYSAGNLPFIMQQMPAGK